MLLRHDINFYHEQFRWGGRDDTSVRCRRPFMAIDLKNASFVKVIYLENGRCIKSVFSFQHDGTTNGPVLLYTRKFIWRYTQFAC
jgi:hypothetical protein